MFGLLQREVPSIGSVYFRGAGGLPPRADEFKYLQAHGVDITKNQPDKDAYWSLQLRHTKWGDAEVIALRSMAVYPPHLVDWSPSLSDEEKQRARAAGAGISVRVGSTRGNVLADRKRLLRYLGWLMGDDGLVAADHGSELFWSRGMLEDELAHDADLDVEALYTVHAVSADIAEVTTVTNGKDAGGDEPRVQWLHTHGLASVGAFDFDILDPSPDLIAGATDPLRSLAFAVLEGSAEPATDHLHIAEPGGHIRFVPAYEFQRSAPPRFAALREHDENHSDNRSVICEPAARGLLARLRGGGGVRPSRFLSGPIHDNTVFRFSTAATDLMAERARNTFGVFKALFGELAEFDLPCVVKLGYPTEGATDASDREHLWFEVHAITDRGEIDGTLMNQPHAVPTMNEGDRGTHSPELLSGWTIMTPLGPITPQHMRAAREIRQDRDRFREFLDLARAADREE